MTANRHQLQELNAGAVLADPAWSFVVRSPKGEGRSASQHYACMTLECDRSSAGGRMGRTRCVAVPVDDDADAAAVAGLGRCWGRTPTVHTGNATSTRCPHRAGDNPC